MQLDRVRHRMEEEQLKRVMRPSMFVTLGNFIVYMHRTPPCPKIKVSFFSNFSQQMFSFLKPISFFGKVEKSRKIIIFSHEKS